MKKSDELLTGMLWLVCIRPRAGWLSGFVANLITWQPENCTNQILKHYQSNIFLEPANIVAKHKNQSNTAKFPIMFCINIWFISVAYTLANFGTWQANIFGQQSKSYIWSKQIFLDSWQQIVLFWSFNHICGQKIFFYTFFWPAYNIACKQYLCGLFVNLVQPVGCSWINNQSIANMHIWFFFKFKCL